LALASRLRRWAERLAPPVSPPTSSTLDTWRARALSAMCAFAIVMGGVPLAVGVLLWPTARGPVIIADLIAFVVLIIVVQTRQAGYRVRATTVILLCAVTGTMSTVLIGLQGAGASWFGVSILLSGLLFDWRAALRMVGVLTAVLTLVGIGIALERVPWAAAMPHALRFWVISASSMLVLYSLLALGIDVLLVGLQAEAEARLSAEDALRRSRRLDAMGTMAAGIAHDFNNLLAPVLANLDLLENTNDRLDAPVVREALTDMRSAASRARNLVRRLLVLRAGEAEERSALDVVTVLQEVAAQVTADAGDSISIRVDARWVPPVAASSNELHQIVMNLARNAVQAMPLGGMLVLGVDAVEAASGPLVEITISDSGIGMDADTLARAFDPFFTRRVDRDGTGLGLPTVRTIVQSLNGDVLLDSAVGKGTTARVRLPAVYSAGLGDLVRTPAQGSAPVLPSRLRVLVVDDDPLVRDGTRRMLTLMGHEAEVAGSAAEALQWLQAREGLCDLLVTDFRMPERSGADLVRATRRRFPAMPIVVASGYVDDALEELAAESPTLAFIAKPFPRRELADAIAVALERIFSSREVVIP
jgi:signal transduction histidine kinase/ActR/RegA family two-component response regulator